MTVKTDFAAWFSKAESYINELDGTVQRMEQILKQFRPEVASSDVQSIDAATEKLAEAVSEMERMVAVRQTLLVDVDAPAVGATITEKIRATSDPQRHQLAARCDEISARLATSHERAVSLFVCQFNLMQLSNEIVGVFSGSSATDSGTYGPQGDRADEQRAPLASPGGGLFNEAG